MTNRAAADIAIESLEDQYRRNLGSRVFSRLADAYRKAGNIQQAIEICIEGLKNHPTYVTGRIILARCYFEQENYGGALEEFTKVCTLDRRNHLALKMLADICAQQGMTEKAGDLYVLLQSLDPTNPVLIGLSSQYTPTGKQDLFDILGVPPPESIPFSLRKSAQPVSDSNRGDQPYDQQQSFDAAAMNQTDYSELHGEPEEQIAYALDENLDELGTGDSSEGVSGSDIGRRMDMMFEETGVAAAESDTLSFADDIPVQDTETGELQTGPSTAPAPISGIDISSRIDELFGAEKPGPGSAASVEIGEDDRMSLAWFDTNSVPASAPVQQPESDLPDFSSEQIRQLDKWTQEPSGSQPAEEYGMPELSDKSEIPVPAHDILQTGISQPLQMNNPPGAELLSTEFDETMQLDQSMLDGTDAISVQKNEVEDAIDNLFGADSVTAPSQLDSSIGFVTADPSMDLISLDDDEVVGSTDQTPAATFDSESALIVELDEDDEIRLDDVESVGVATDSAMEIEEIDIAQDSINDMDMLVSDSGAENGVSGEDVVTKLDSMFGEDLISGDEDAPLTSTAGRILANHDEEEAMLETLTFDKTEIGELVDVPGEAEPFVIDSAPSQADGSSLTSLRESDDLLGSLEAESIPDDEDQNENTSGGFYSVSGESATLGPVDGDKTEEMLQELDGPTETTFFEEQLSDSADEQFSADPGDSMSGSLVPPEVLETTPDPDTNIDGPPTISGQDIKDRLDQFFASDDLTFDSSAAATLIPEDDEEEEDPAHQGFYTLDGESATPQHDTDLLSGEQEELEQDAIELEPLSVDELSGPLPETSAVLPGAHADLMDVMQEEEPQQQVEMNATADPRSDDIDIGANYQSGTEPGQVDERDKPYSIPDHVLTPTLADIYYQQGQPHLALDIYQRLLERDQDNVKLQSKISKIMASIGSGAVTGLLPSPQVQSQPRKPEKDPPPKPAVAPKRKKTANDKRPLSGVRLKKRKKDSKGK